MNKKIYYLFIFIFSFSVLSAQEKLSKEEKARREKNIQAGNPFAQFGYKAKIATLSKGKYLEFHDLDSIVTIGTVRWHVYKNEIVGRIVQDSINPDAQPIGDRAGRWISPDPLSEEFSSWSPYNFCYNNPVNFVDPDGRSGEPVLNMQNKTITVTSNLIYYGGAGSTELARQSALDIQNQWNGANSVVNIGGVDFKVNFVINGEYRNVSADEISNNTDIKNNYFKVSETGLAVSYTDTNGDNGGNTGEFLLKNIVGINSTTEGHEYGHSLGSVKSSDGGVQGHPGDSNLLGNAGAPGIMYPRGTAVDAQYTYKPSNGASTIDPNTGARTNTMNPETRKVNQTDINNLHLDRVQYDSNGKGQLGTLTNTPH